jgi:hypothetical protein
MLYGCLAQELLSCGFGSMRVGCAKQEEHFVLKTELIKQLIVSYPAKLVISVARRYRNAEYGQPAQ